MNDETENPDVLYDPVGTLEDVDAPRSKWELSPDGYYERWIPSEDEHDAVSNYVYSYIRSLEADNTEILNEVAENIDAYRAKTKIVGSKSDEEPVVTLPLISRKIDQLVAFQTATLLRPRPIVSVDPYFDDVYEVMSSQKVPDPMTGQMVEVGVPKQFDSEEVAATLEFGLDYKLRERMPIRQVLKKTVQDLAIANYSVVKVVWDQKYRTVRNNKITRLPNGMAVVDGLEERILRGKDAAQITNVNLFAFLAPLDCAIEDAELVCELAPMSVTDFREKLTTGEFFLPKQDTWQALVHNTTKDFRLSQDRSRSLNAPDAQERHDTREVWFEWPIEFEEFNEDGTSYTVLKRTQLCGIYHMQAKRFMTLYRNPYHHGRAPYVLITEDEDARRRPELSLVGRTKKHQALVSQMLHLNIQNAVAASNFDIFCVPETDAWDALTTQSRRPGRLIPRNDKDEVEMRQAGQNHPGLNQEIGMLIQDISDTMGVSPYEEGTMVPGRTPADTVRQILQSGLQRPMMTMATISDGFGEIIKMYLKVLKQFQPYGELVPTKDPDTNDKIMVPFLLPVDDVLDNFDIALTAAEEELAKEADQEQRIMLFNLLGQASGTWAQMAGAMADVNASPALTNMFAEMLGIQMRAFKLIVEPVRKDVSKFLPAKETIAAIVAEKQQNVQLAMQQQQQQMAMGAMGGAEPGAEGSTGTVPQAGVGAGAMGPMAGPPAN